MVELVDPVSLDYAAGKDVSLQFTVTDEDDTAVDITGMTVRFVVARRVDSTPVLSTEDSPQTATYALTTPASGIFTVTLDAADTAGLSGNYRFEAEVEDSGGDKVPVAWGFITFDPALI